MPQKTTVRFLVLAYFFGIQFTDFLKVGTKLLVLSMRFIVK